MLSIFVDLNGTIIHTDSTHLYWIVQNIEAFDEVELREDVRSIFYKLKDVHENYEDYLLSETEHNSSELLVWDFLEASGYIRVFDNSIMVPSCGMNQSQVFSLKKVLTNNLIISYNSEDFNINLSDFLNIDFFEDLRL